MSPDEEIHLQIRRILDSRTARKEQEESNGLGIPQASPPPKPPVEDIHTQLMRKILERRNAMNEQEEPKGLGIKTQESDEWSQ